MAKNEFYSRYTSRKPLQSTDFKGHPEVCNQLIAEECEINKILHQFEAGEIDTLPVARDVVYNDMFVNPTTYFECKEFIDKVKNDYDTLPKDIQRQFGSFDKYINDLPKIASGDVTTLAKYPNFLAKSPVQNVATGSDLTASSGPTSSSISRSDSENGSPVVNNTNNNSFAEIEV